MRKILRIAQSHIGLLYEDGKFVRVLETLRAMAASGAKFAVGLEAEVVTRLLE